MKNAETNKKRRNKFVYDYNGQKQIVWDNLTKRKRNPTMAENSSIANFQIFERVDLEMT